VALKTSLVIGGDASGAERALAETGAALGGAEKEAQALARAYTEADGAIGRLAAAQTEATREIEAAKAAYKAGELGLDQYNRQILETKSALGLIQTEYRGAMKGLQAANDDFDKARRSANDNFEGVGSGARLAGHHIQNLAFQFQDLGVQIASGANPMTAFVQQGSQISGVLMQAGVGVGGMVRQLAGMVGGFLVANPLLIGAGVAAAGAGVAFMGFQSTLEQKAPVDQYIKSLGLTAEEAAKLTDAHVTLGDTASAAWDLIKKGLGLDSVFSSIKGWATDAAKWLYDVFKNAVASVYAAFKATYDNIGFIWSNLPALLGDAVLLAANRQIVALQGIVNAGITALNWLAGKANEIFGTSFGQIAKVDLSGLKFTYSAAGQELGRRFGASFDAAKQEALAGFDRFEDAVIQKRNDRLASQAADIIKKRSKAAESGAGDAGKKSGDKFAEQFAKSLEALNAEISRDLSRQSADMAKRYAAMANDGLAAVRADISRQTAERVQPFLDAAEATAEWNVQLDATIDRLNQIGGLGADIANWAKALTKGDFSGLSGATGVALQSLWGLNAGTMFDKTSKTDISVTLGERMEQIFSRDGAFGKTLKEMLQGGGTGLAFSTAIMGQSGNNFGALAGGALGEKFGEKVLASGFDKIAKGLGSFAGPLGSILGGVLGGVLGSVFGKKPRGSGTVTNSGVTTSANDGGIKGSLDSFGLGLQQAVSSIADKLGGKVGAYSVGIGAYKDYFQVSHSANDPYLGQSNYARKSGMDAYDGKDASAALRAAISVAIEQGAIQGVRAGAQTLLKAGNDIEAQLAKALKFQAVFDDVRQATDPLGFALDGVAKKFADLRGIFAEAGATTEDYAQLEQLLASERKKAIDDISQAYNDRFFSDAEKLAKSQAAVTAEMQRLGLAGVTTKDQFKAVVAGIDLTSDAGVKLYGSLMQIAGQFADVAEGADSATQAVADQAKALDAQRQSMQADLLEAQGRTAAATALRRQQELAALDESLRPLQMEIYLAQDVTAARDALNQAYKRESDTLKQTVDKFNAYATGLRKLRDSLLLDDTGGATGYASALAQLKGTGSLAALGNEASINALPDAARSFLSASRGTAGSFVEYQRDLARTIGIVDNAISGTSGMASAAQRQLDALEQQVDGLVTVNESVLSVDQAIADLRALTDQQGSDYAAQQQAANEASARAQADLLAEVRWMREEGATREGRLLELAARSDTFLKRLEVEGLYVRGPTAGDPAVVTVV